MSDENTITIPIEEYRYLLERNDKLSYLVARGLDIDELMSEAEELFYGDDE